MLSIKRLKFGLFLNEQTINEISKKINMSEDEILYKIKEHDIVTCKKVANEMNVDYRWLMGADIPMNEFIGEVGIQLLEDAYRDELK